MLSVGDTTTYSVFVEMGGGSSFENRVENLVRLVACLPQQVQLSVERRNRQGVAAFGFDVDIDNENHWGGESFRGGDYFTTDYKTPGSRALRDQIGPYIGKVLFVNDIDKDGSGTPDFMDGWGCPLNQIPRLEREKTSGSNHRAVNAENRFVPVSVSLAAIPSDKVGSVRVRFDYPDSPPETLQRVALTGSGWDNVGPDNRPPAYKITSPTGYIRIWKKDGNVARNVATDYVKSNQTVMTYSELQNLSTPGTFYLEAINPSQNWSDIRIVVSLSLDNGQTWITSSAVRVTSMRCNFTVGVVRQYYQTSVLGTRTEFVPDYSNPALCLQKFAGASFENNGYIWRKSTFHLGPWTPDDSWHEGEDALLGHGFAYFQYEGPDLDNFLSIFCYTPEATKYDHKFYRGKTGKPGLTFWDYGAGMANDQQTLAWWDICQYKLDVPSTKYLVVKKSYTLHPDKAAAMCQTFSGFLLPPGLSFGLHIDPPNQGWGCLSNVGLVMREHNVDTVNMEKCFVNKDMPVTANASVWAVIMGKDLQGEHKSKVKNALNVVVAETQGLPWGGSKPTLGANALQGKLFNVLKNEKIIVRVPGAIDGHSGVTNTITTLSDIDLDGATDNLQYFDPGLFPVMFGEQPASVFDVSN
ncbi:MAG: hypothetical protein FWH21_07455 [Kiritimatiellaeota bacterium]|nr:hypothetical protein [Kiritimatiellota bacterium]